MLWVITESKNSLLLIIGSLVLGLLKRGTLICLLMEEKRPPVCKQERWLKGLVHVFFKVRSFGEVRF